MSYTFNEYLISKDKSKLKTEEIKHLLAQTYWASERTEETIEKAVAHSICYGVYDGAGTLVGFARVITDFATTFYLCDVIIDLHHRFQGLGKELVRFVTEDTETKGLLGLLFTRDAHGLYEKVGFQRDHERCMIKSIR